MARSGARHDVDRAARDPAQSTSMPLPGSQHHHEDSGGLADRTCPRSGFIFPVVPSCRLWRLRWTHSALPHLDRLRTRIAGQNSPEATVQLVRAWSPRGRRAMFLPSRSFAVRHRAPGRSHGLASGRTVRGAAALRCGGCLPVGDGSEVHARSRALPYPLRGLRLIGGLRRRGALFRESVGIDYLRGSGGGISLDACIMLSLRIASSRFRQNSIATVMLGGAGQPLDHDSTASRDGKGPRQ